METNFREFGNLQFHEPERNSGHILAVWLDRSGVKYKTLLEELKGFGGDIDQIGSKSIRQWTSDVVSSKLVSGTTPEIRGNRVVALVRWFIREHQHRLQPIINLDELRQFIGLYSDLPVKHRLQLRRILHEFEFSLKTRDAQSLFLTGDWREQYAEWPVFGFVVDELWCFRASNVYDLEMVGLNEEDMKHWDWWHRLTTRVSNYTKFSPGSPFGPLRGPYADIYYRYQMKYFKRNVGSPAWRDTPRCETLLNLLKQTEGFTKEWDRGDNETNVLPTRSVGVPLPFFRPDGTLLWLFEVSAIIPGTDNYRLIVWSPVDEDTSEYLAEIRRQANEPGRYSRKTFFIEDYADYFSKEERFALGVGF